LLPANSHWQDQNTQCHVGVPLWSGAGSHSGGLLISTDTCNAVEAAICIAGQIPGLNDANKQAAIPAGGLRRPSALSTCARQWPAPGDCNCKDERSHRVPSRKARRLLQLAWSWRKTTLTMSPKLSCSWTMSMRWPLRARPLLQERRAPAAELAAHRPAAQGEHCDAVHGPGMGTMAHLRGRAVPSDVSGNRNSAHAHSQDSQRQRDGGSNRESESESRHEDGEADIGEDEKGQQ
jgi:hypothetical protein